MATQGERIDALEAGLKELTEKLTGFAETLEAIKTAKDAEAAGEPVDLAALTADVAKLKEEGEALAKLRDQIAEIQPVELEAIPEFDGRAELLAAHRKIETIANHLNIRLPG